MKWSSILYAYLRRRLKLMTGFFIVLLLFVTVCFLYGVPLEPLLYASLLCAFLGMIFACYDFYQFWQRHSALCSILKGISAQLGKLPPAHDLIEHDYQNIIQTLHADNLTRRSAADNREQELLDYYTLWAHQIKTPLFAMRLQLRSDHLVIPDLEQELFKIEEYTQMALYYQRLGSISSDLLLKEYSLCALVRQTVKKYASVFIYKKLSLTMDDTDATVLTDEKWVCFILEQLLSNALKYTVRGGVHIYVEQSLHTTLVIEDTGIGIRPEDIPRLFERGFTGYNGRMDKKASGLGLYLCREISEKLSLRLFIESNPGLGTKVSLSFPSDSFVLD